MSRYFEMTDFWMENLLDDTGDYTIESNEKGKFVNILVNVKKESSVLGGAGNVIKRNEKGKFIKILEKVKKESMGKIIGKNGRVITSLRTLVSSVAKKDKKIVKIEVKEF